MNKNAKKEQFITDFTAMMYAKGYRGPVTLQLDGGHRPLPCRHLGDCLDHFFTQQKLGYFKEGRFTFVTEVSDIFCDFQVALEPVMGFEVKSLKVTSKKGHPPLRYHGFYSHRQIPGAAQLPGLFPKDKPWLNFKRGRYRP